MPDQQSLFEFAEQPEWERAAEDDVLVAEVVFNLPLEKPYTYLIPDELRELLKAGMRVKAPLGRGNRTVVGYCVNIRSAGEMIRKLKPIHEVLDPEPLLDQLMLKLTKWIGERYLCGWGQVLESVIPAGVRRRSGTRLVQSFFLAEDSAAILDVAKLPVKQQAVVDVLKTSDKPLTGPRICELADCGPGPINTLRKKGIVTAIKVRSAVSGELV